MSRGRGGVNSGGNKGNIGGRMGNIGGRWGNSGKDSVGYGQIKTKPQDTTGRNPNMPRSFWSDKGY